MASIISFNIIKENQGREQNQKVLANNKTAKPIMFYNVTDASMEEELTGNMDLYNLLRDLEIFSIDFYTNTKLYGIMYNITTEKMVDKTISVQNIYPLETLHDGNIFAKAFIAYIVQNNSKVKTKEDLEIELREKSKLSPQNIDFILKCY